MIYMYVLWIVVCPFVFFPLVIVLSVFLRFTDSDFPFGILELFLRNCNSIYKCGRPREHGTTLVSTLFRLFVSCFGGF
jgi:hypothetical protein